MVDDVAAEVVDATSERRVDAEARVEGTSLTISGIMLREVTSWTNCDALLPTKVDGGANAADLGVAAIAMAASAAATESLAMVANRFCWCRFVALWTVRPRFDLTVI